MKLIWNLSSKRFDWSVDKQPRSMLVAVMFLVCWKTAILYTFKGVLACSRVIIRKVYIIRGIPYLKVYDAAWCTNIFRLKSSHVNSSLLILIDFKATNISRTTFLTSSNIIFKCRSHVCYFSWVEVANYYPVEARLLPELVDSLWNCFKLVLLCLSYGLFYSWTATMSDHL